MQKRIAAYTLISFLLFLLPWVPLPFQKPEMLHDIFSARYFVLTRYGLIACCMLASAILLICVLVIRARKNVWNLKLFTEGLVLLALPFACWLLLFAINNVSPPFDTITRINQNRESSTFVNPYLGYKKFNCTSVGSKYDQVFMPAHIGSAQASFVVFAPRRLDKSISYSMGRKDGDWYLEHKDSAWDEELYKCGVSA